jgi:hypothetical protein
MRVLLLLRQLGIRFRAAYVQHWRNISPLFRRRPFQYLALASVVASGAVGVVGAGQLTAHDERLPEVTIGNKHNGAANKPLVAAAKQAEGSVRNTKLRSAPGKLSVSAHTNTTVRVDSSSSSNSADNRTTVVINGKSIAVSQDRSFSKHTISPDGSTSVDILHTSSDNGSSSFTSVDVSSDSEGDGL